MRQTIMVVELREYQKEAAKNKGLHIDANL